MAEARISQIQLRTPPVMLVRIDEGQEPRGLRIDDLPFPIVRVRHPLPACTRILVLKPAVVLVGRTVQPRDFVLMVRAADEVGAAIVLVDALSPAGLYEWTVRSVAAVRERREARASGQPLAQAS